MFKSNSVYVEVIFPSLLLIITLIFLCSIIEYYSSCKKAQIYNSINSTNYSCGDFYWASEQINSNLTTIKIK